MALPHKQRPLTALFGLAYSVNYLEMRCPRLPDEKSGIINAQFEFWPLESNTRT